MPVSNSKSSKSVKTSRPIKPNNLKCKKRSFNWFRNAKKRVSERQVMNAKRIQKNVEKMELMCKQNVKLFKRSKEKWKSKCLPMSRCQKNKLLKFIKDRIEEEDRYKVFDEQQELILQQKSLHHQLPSSSLIKAKYHQNHQIHH